MVRDDVADAHQDGVKAAVAESTARKPPPADDDGHLGADHRKLIEQGDERMGGHSRSGLRAAKRNGTSGR